MRVHGALPAQCPYRIALEAFEREMLTRAMDAAEQNVSTVAARLGVSRKYVYDRFKALGMEVRYPRSRPHPKKRIPEPAPAADPGEDLAPTMETI